MEFFKIWQSRNGVIGVNRMSLSDLVGANMMAFAIYCILLMLLVQLLPILLLSFYIILLLNNRFGIDGENDTQQRLMINILTICSVVYFLIDFHFGWLCFNIFSVVVSKETYDSFAVFNLSIGLVSTFLFFLGHEIFNKATSMLIRLAMFVLIVYFGMKLTKPISRTIINSVITQYNDDEIQKNRDIIKENDINNQQFKINQEKINNEKKQEDIDREQKKKDFDKEYAKKYLTN